MRFTGMSRLAQANDDVQQFADRTYKQARKYHRLELEVRDDKPEFEYYFGFRSSHRWQVAALKVVQQQHALAAYYGMSARASEMLKALIENPTSFLEQYTDEVEMLEQARLRRR